LRSRIASLALVTCLGAGLAGCGISNPQQSAAGRPRHSPESGAKPSAGCPRGRPLPPGQGAAVDYIDFLRLNGRNYDQVHEPIAASQLGPVVTHIRCSLMAEEDDRRSPPPIINRTASALSVGTPVYQVRGYPSACRLAAYLHGSLHVYLAQAKLLGQFAPRPLACALRPAAGAVTTPGAPAS
jgi:hypothetical protein